mmetsp:Transcript_25310/g.58794  ORF Transcript_25310/g.58794 Transcript_25310/m.58794 type:complete len:185 (+) Transcript_25310:74-628(+)
MDTSAMMASPRLAALLLLVSALAPASVEGTGALGAISAATALADTAITASAAGSRGYAFSVATTGAIVHHKGVAVGAGATTMAAGALKAGAAGSAAAAATAGFIQVAPLVVSAAGLLALVLRATYRRQACRRIAPHHLSSTGRKWSPLLPELQQQSTKVLRRMTQRGCNTMRQQQEAAVRPLRL